MAERIYTFLCTFIAFIMILSGIEGLRCRLENDSKTVEEFEDMVRICLRSPISPQDKSKNKQNWNNNNRGTNNNKNNNGRFGKESEEEDDYDDNYGEEPKNDTSADKKNQSKTKQNNKRTSNSNNFNGGSKIGTRSRRSPQYSNGGYNSRDYDVNYGRESQYPMNSMMQGNDMKGQGGFGYRDNRGNNNDRMGGNNYNMGGNGGYNMMEGHGNYKPGRYRRYAQYSSGNNWNNGGYDNQNGQRNRQGEYGNRGNSRENYGISGRPEGYNSGSSNGGYGNNEGSSNGGYSNNGGYGNPYSGGNGAGGKEGGYGLYDNRGSSANYSPGSNRNSSKGFKEQQSSPLNTIKPCVIHCILRHKKMLDEDSTPDKAAVMSVMTKHIKERELKEFIQDSVNECFDNMESDDNDGKCDMSKSLMICLEEKGKQNCDDWDTAGPSTNPDKWFANSNSRPPNPQRPPAWG